MRTLISRRTTRHGTAPAVFAALVLAAVAAGPILAKEGFQARLDAPMGRDTPGGTTLLVGMTVTFPDGSVVHPVEGSPIYLELVGKDGASVRAMGREDASGHYLAQIEVPPTGIASVAIGIRGTSDLPIGSRERRSCRVASPRGPPRSLQHPPRRSRRSSGRPSRRPPSFPRRPSRPTRRRPQCPPCSSSPPARSRDSSRASR